MMYLGISVVVIREPWNLHIPLMALPSSCSLRCRSRPVRHGSSSASRSRRRSSCRRMWVRVAGRDGDGLALVCIGVDTRRAGRLPDRWRSTVTITSGVLVLLWLPPLVDVIAGIGRGTSARSRSTSLRARISTWGSSKPRASWRPSSASSRRGWAAKRSSTGSRASPRPAAGVAARTGRRARRGCARGVADRTKRRPADGRARHRVVRRLHPRDLEGRRAPRTHSNGAS